MPLTSLATVELQLIMRACDRRSLLALARCAHFALRAASADFAWSGASQPLTLRSTRPNLGACVTGSLVRFAPIRLHWHPPASAAAAAADGEDADDDDDDEDLLMQPTVSAEELESLCAVPHVRVLDALGRRNVTASDWSALLANPAMRGLTALYVAASFSGVGAPSFGRTQLRLLTQHQTQLNTLHLLEQGDDDVGIAVNAPAAAAAEDKDKGEVHMYSLLPRLGNLTDLRLDGSNGGLEHLSSCATLRRLTICSARADELLALLLSSSADGQLAARLEHLALDDFIVCPRACASFGAANAASANLDLAAEDDHAKAAAAEEQWSRIFASMHSLRSLMLQCCYGVDALLSAAAAVAASRCPSLAELSVRPVYLLPRAAATPRSKIALHGSTMPSVSTVRVALESNHHVVAATAPSASSSSSAPSVPSSSSTRSGAGTGTGLTLSLHLPTKQEYDDYALDADMGSDEDHWRQVMEAFAPLAAQYGPRGSSPAAAAASSGSNSNSPAPNNRRFMLLFDADAEIKDNDEPPARP